MDRLRFYLNDRLVEESGLSPTTTLLRYLRERAHLTGTKEGCAEGDCGACTVAVLEQDGKGAQALRAINSCLLLLPMLQGKRVYTVEALKESGKYHVVQEELSKALGSQCGYCTPGVAMAMLEACHRKDFDEPWKLDAQMCGNLCRCTGYRPIREATARVAGLNPVDRFSKALVQTKPEPMELSYAAGSQRFFTPATLEALWDVLDANPEARFVVGGTDLSLEVTKRYAEPPILVSLEALPSLRALEPRAGGHRVGATVSLTDLEDYARSACPPLERMLRYFGARQIKNRATVGGNLCNASPIGDLAPVFIALGAEAVLLSRAGERRLPLEDFFVAYRRTALQRGEILAFVEVPAQPAGARTIAYKVSKRRELDISAVAAGFRVVVDAQGRVAEARLAYGGMAARPARARRTEEALVGKPWEEASVEAALPHLDEDFTPLTDHRGSTWYRALVAKNLLRGFFQETLAEPAPRLQERHAATVQVR
ncbi:xanthine dehydrogenase small subunit [Hyalangium rubrum]|uniref:Xanthine dehydrogenase small subunit n=1 Tax=Hyalangium rubrum TaxID=3103134 RepID=A0ABU5H6F2_9BACT|nr:xanthine dehydrogenase small subunit [Hyalangium sp. s54d21]MDY7229054.1 xanthine dehydrogenase small subunit [Hyalangium sp. s54d21]